MRWPLRAVHDKLGTVTRIVLLRSNEYDGTAGFAWTAGTLFLDAGGLDPLARRAGELVARR